ncbi:hypothetical protein [Leptospira weilii]|uniref:hypothetical protein n=1 Tax=Leptospira weilii TaxID=28184 RepID=UPI0002FD548E|nr:hypothetical protein [Leptospira weilii]ULH29075.1 hypothetical protein FH586_03830 [Leptospira weilii]UPY79321.1 hypothetical protein FH581_010915 [Leptospira weilii]
MDEDLKKMIYEFTGQDDYNCFAVIGSTEESGEEETLENILDTQINRILMYA